MKVSSDPWYNRTMETARKPYEVALKFFNAAMAEASGPDGTWCVSSEKQRAIGQDLFANTGWTLRQLQDAQRGADPLAGEVIEVTVAPDRDVPALAKMLAGFSRRGARVRMYPSGPFH